MNLALKKSEPVMIARDKTALQKTAGEWKTAGLKIALVPTMGALHAGHLSLIEIAGRQADRVVVSIFVNPTQFAPHEDFSAYPRNEKADIAKLEKTGANLVYIPEAEDIYPVIPVSDIRAGSAAKGLEGDIRPDHFDGVVTVVSRLFKYARPDTAVFGEKDYQQLCVIRQMVAEKNMNVEIVAAPIVRDAEGLALSSRNTYLSAEELKIARRLNRVLSETAKDLKKLPQARQRLLDAGFDEVQYLELRDAETLAPVSKPPARLLAAVKIGKTRLIDNVAV